MAGQGAELRREIRPEGESGSGGRGKKTLGIGSGWVWQGHFLTDATLALELIHMEESQGRKPRKRGGDTSREHSPLGSHSTVIKCFPSVYPHRFGKEEAGLSFPFCSRKN